MSPECSLLDAFLPGDRRRALAGEQPLQDPAHGAVLFADISGFTALTESLANDLGAQRGSEALTLLLNDLFERLIDELAGFGGEVLGFAGDAITCWLDGDDGARATACALAMQRCMAEHGEVEATGGRRVTLAAKIAVAVGTARRIAVGDPAIQRIDVLAGALVDRVAAAERLAGRGEVLADASVVEHVGNALEVREWRRDEASGRAFAVIGAMHSAPLRATRVPPPPLAVDVVRSWALPGLEQRMQAQHGAFLAEFRPVCSLFIGFSATDVDHDIEGSSALDRFVSDVQRTLAAFGGHLLQVTLGDKGGYLYAAFGAPVAHEDDAARACMAALRLRETTTPDGRHSVRLGLTHGRLYSGTYGHPQRRAFGCMGDAVNLAARLMAYAPEGAIYATPAVRERAGAAFRWRTLGPLTVRGKAQPVDVVALMEAVDPRVAGQGARDLMVGRARELGVLRAAFDDANAGRGGVVGVVAEAGVGKSRLVEAFRHTLEHWGGTVAYGACERYGHRATYGVWREVWSALLGLDGRDSVEHRVRALEACIARIDPLLVPRLPLLGGVLDLPIADTPLTASFDPKLRKASLEDLLVTLLHALARERPLLIVLEDCHWIDELSADLLHVLARVVPDVPVLIVATWRPDHAASLSTAASSWPRFVELSLPDLVPADAMQLVQAKLRPLLPAGHDPAPALVELVTTRAQGNPFAIGELVGYLAARALDLTDEAAWRTLELPDSLHSLVLSRIDAVAEGPRRTLKVASVVGRVFEGPALPRIYPDLGSDGDVQAQLGVLSSVALVAPEPSREATYAFRHALTQEVAYESLPFSLRALLHECVGRHVEEGGPEAIERSVDVLAHHYGHTDNLPKKREYLLRAGEAAQRANANRAAIDYFERLVPIVEGRERIDVLLRLVKVLELTDWVRAQATANRALDLARDEQDALRMARCDTALAEIARKQGRYDEARERLDRAEEAFSSAGDAAGAGEVHHLLGTLAAQRGDYPAADAHYAHSLRIRQALDDKAAMGALYSNLGVVAEYRGDLDASRRHHEQAMALRREIGDRRGIGVSCMNIGMTAFLQKQHAEALEWFRQALAASREVGDGWMVALASHNLGNAARAMGNYDGARRHYADSVVSFAAFGDRWAYAFLFEDIGVMAALQGDAASALDLLGAADAIREASSTPRAPSLARELEEHLAPAVAHLGQDERDRLRAQGRALAFTAAVQRALAACQARMAHEAKAPA